MAARRRQEEQHAQPVFRSLAGLARRNGSCRPTESPAGRWASREDETAVSSANRQLVSRLHVAHRPIVGNCPSSRCCHHDQPAGPRADGRTVRTVPYSPPRRRLILVRNGAGSFPNWHSLGQRAGCGSALAPPAAEGFRHVRRRPHMAQGARARTCRCSSWGSLAIGASIACNEIPSPRGGGGVGSRIRPRPCKDLSAPNHPRGKMRFAAARAARHTGGWWIVLKSFLRSAADPDRLPAAGWGRNERRPAAAVPWPFGARRLAPCAGRGRLTAPAPPPRARRASQPARADGRSLRAARPGGPLAVRRRRGREGRRRCWHARPPVVFVGVVGA